MNESVYRRDTCRLCGSRDLSPALSLTPTPLADSYIPADHLDETQPAYPLDLYLCDACGFLQMLDVIHPKVIYLDYIYETKSSLGLAAHFQNYADEVLKRIDPPQESLVADIGSNDGILLRAFQNRGMRVLGVEPARHIAREATESGIKTLPEFFTSELAQSIKKDYGSAAIITMNNLFANIDNLADVTRGIRDLLAPDGVFIFESFYLGDLMQNMVFDFIYHEHLSYFSAGPLDAFFRRHGMEIVDIQRVPTKGGSLHCTIQLEGGPRSVSASVGDLIRLEQDQGINRADTFKVFASHINAAKQRTLDYLRDLKVRGKTIAGYGASATSTTLLYHFEWVDILDFLADDNPSKQDMFSPGCHIPVFSSQSLYERKPDYVVILAWRFAQPIMQKHQAYLDQGGHFNVPLPELEVI